MKMEVVFGKKKYHIQVEFYNRKRLSITVYPDLTIKAKAPDGYDFETTQNWLKSSNS